MIETPAFKNFITLLTPILKEGGRTVETVDGKKYIKIIAVTFSYGGGRSAYAFVDKTNGDILMAASWKAPAKHARGNINDENPVTCCTPYGVKYLK